MCDASCSTAILSRSHPLSPVAISRLPLSLTHTHTTERGGEEERRLITKNGIRQASEPGHPFFLRNKETRSVYMRCVCVESVEWRVSVVTNRGKKNSDFQVQAKYQLTFNQHSINIQSTFNQYPIDIQSTSNQLFSPLSSANSCAVNSQNPPRATKTRRRWRRRPRPNMWQRQRGRRRPI